MSAKDRAKDPVPESQLPREIGLPARRALAAQGRTTLEQLTELSERELLAIHGVGPKAVGLLREHLADRGLALAGG